MHPQQQAALIGEPAAYHEADVDVWRSCGPVRADVERVMADTVAELAGPLTVPIQRVVGASGKRLRPALTLTFATLGRGAVASGSWLGGAVDCAAAVELLHCATLIHDDLIDGSDLRRGVPAVSAQEGTSTAVVAGDLLIAAASLLAGQVSRHAAVLLARTLAELCRGEALEEEHRFDARTSDSELLDVVRAKTGSLVGAACLLGARCASDDDDAAAAAAEYGMQFGICLQLVDDLLDIVSTPQLAGKPVGADFAAGTVTLPAALAMSSHAELRELLVPSAAAVDRERALELLRCPDAILTTVRIAVQHAERAGSALREWRRHDRAVESIAELPARYLRAQLQRKISPELRYLISPADLSA